MKKLPEHRKWIPTAHVEQRHRKAWVYAIQCGDFVKIGMSADFQKRFNQLQVSNPYPLALIMRRGLPYWARREFEQLVHDALKDKQLRNEWFSITPEEARAAIQAAYTEMKRRCGIYERRWDKMIDLGRATAAALEDEENEYETTT